MPVCNDSPFLLMSTKKYAAWNLYRVHQSLKTCSWTWSSCLAPTFTGRRTVAWNERTGRGLRKSIRSPPPSSQTTLLLLGKGFYTAPGFHSISTFLPDIFLRTRLFILLVVINDDKITYDKLQVSGLNCQHLK